MIEIYGGEPMIQMAVLEITYCLGVAIGLFVGYLWWGGS